MDLHDRHGVRRNMPLDEVKAILRRLERRLVGFDIETVGFDPGPGRYVRTMQFYTGKEWFLFDVRETGLEPFREELEGMFLIAFNASFEAKWFRAAGIGIDKLDCARLLHMATYRRAWGGRDKGGPGTSLADLTKDYLGKKRDKSYQASDWSGELSREQIEYAADDAIDALDLWNLFSDLATDDQIATAYPMLRNAMPCLVWMEETGLDMDLAAHEILDRRLTKGADLADRKLASLAPINWASGKQLGDWIFARLPVDLLEKWPTTETGRMSTSTKTFRRFMDRLPPELHRPVALMLLRSNRRKMVSTYGKSMLTHLDGDGTLHGSINQCGAVTGRPTSSAPNLLNMPRLPIFRRCFKARKGRKLVVADYGQIEFRVASALAGNDPTMERIFDEGGDIHIETAGHMFRKKPEDVAPRERQAAKATGFGVLFGMGAPSLSIQLRCSQAEAKGYIGEWLNTYPAIADNRKVDLDFATVGPPFVMKPFPSGRTIQWLKEPPPSQVYNYPVQGTAAELMYYALGLLYPALLSTNIVPWIQVYDEVVLCAPEDEAEMGAFVLEQAMKAGALKGLPNINMTGIVEATIGETWADK